MTEDEAAVNLARFGAEGTAFDGDTTALRGVAVLTAS